MPQPSLGVTIARAWERYVGNAPVDDIFTTELIAKEFDNEPDFLVKQVEQSALQQSRALIPNGLILEPVSQGCHHEWERSPINMIWTCRRCARSMSELEICRNASSLASQLESYVQV